jgi:glyoxylase-like metal-dependent hydrolase (beta-lactamase superfamily II)
MTSPQPPLKAVIIPVTPLQQNCCLIWCTQTMRGAFTDPGGDLDRLKAEAAKHKVTIEKLLLTHGHIDHCGSAKLLADELGVQIEGPHEADRFWIDRLEEDGRKYGITGQPFESDRWLDEGDQVTVGNLSLDVYHCPGHTPGHVVFHHPPSKLAIVGDVLFQARSAAPTSRWATPGPDRRHHHQAVAAWRRHGVRARPWSGFQLRP